MVKERSGKGRFLWACATFLVRDSKLACFTFFLVNGFARAFRCCVRGFSRKIFLHNALELQSPAAICPHVRWCRFCRCSAWLLAASSDSNLGKVYIIGFLKVCNLLWYTSYGDSGCEYKIRAGWMVKSQVCLLPPLNFFTYIIAL